MVPLSAFRAIPVGEPGDSTTWILWHPRAGAYTLDVKRRGRDRFAVLSAAKGKPSWGTRIDDRLEFPLDPRAELRTPLPGNAAASGPELLDTALAAIQADHEPAPLRLRSGRARDDLETAIRAASLLALQIGSIYDMSSLICRFDPNVTIPDTQKLMASDPRAPNPETMVLDDIGNWFGAYAPLGPGLAKLRGGKRSTADWATLKVSQPERNPTAHALMAAAAVLTDFYERAAADLDLSAAQIEARLASMGCATAAPQS